MYIQFYNSPKGIKLDNYYFQEDEYKFLGPIKNLNFFVGANNSGKSRFMREILKFYFILEFENSKILEKKDSISLIINEFYNKYKDIKTPIIKIIETYANEYDPIFIEFAKQNELEVSFIGTREFSLQSLDIIRKNIKNILDNLKTSSLEELISGIKFFLKEGELFLKVKEFLNTNKIFRSERYNFFHFDNMSESFVSSLKNLLECLNIFVGNLKFQNNYLNNKIYIPVLRTSYKIHGIPTEDREDILLKTVKSNYNFHENTYEEIDYNKIEIFTGNTLYSTFDKLSHGILADRKKYENFKKFFNRTFLDSKELNIIAHKNTIEESSENTILLNLDEFEHELHNYGDGINNILILLYKIFECENYSWIFIEEPENSLHPAFQRIFIDTILNDEYLKSKNLKIFVTTHSNHLLDSSIENVDKVSLFTFERILKNNEEHFKIENVSSGDLKILNLLGINNSSIFLSNCSIWVEGITDRKYLKAYLKAYMDRKEFKGKKYLEDVHFCFFEYAGSNLKHYIFKNDEDDNLSKELEEEEINAKFLSNRIFLLADRDKGKETKHEILKVQENINFEYRITDGLEVENYISVELLRLALPKLSTKISEDEVNEKEITEGGYLNEYMGSYLKGLFPEKKIKIAAESGTLESRYKTELADIVSRNVKWENMSDGAKKLTEEIYSFIKKQNEY